ncbi:MAG: hypothetical protein CVV25_06010 [Ignavibacteriae bacterium HGW-Ignavibacteriae-4]|jgi:hypothetical protein|nr:MAG: hypothetical protein CVV25_06010 [Ignavibacteriae bacterium HGW-Ignavibacteriae-4]
MKTRILLILFLAVSLANAKNPYEHFGYNNSEMESKMENLRQNKFMIVNEDTTSKISALFFDFNLAKVSIIARSGNVEEKEIPEEMQLRWSSVDPLAGSAPDWSPYRFGFDNPIRYTDPDGRWEKDDNGNLVAEKGDNAWSFSSYLNTSPERSIKMLGEQGYTVNDKGILQLNVGDIFKVENSSSAPYRSDLRFIGNNIRDNAGSEFSKNMFENYWTGGGDVELSSQRFAGILLYVKENKPKTSGVTNIKLKNSDGTYRLGYRQNVSFYSTSEYNKVFGTSQLYYNQNDEIVGFYDYYDFDSKDNWSERGIKNELITRTVDFFSPNSSKPFSIKYGFSKR